MAKEVVAFERDTVHRLAVETARFWVISTFLCTKKIPAVPAVLYAYPNGATAAIDWGNAPGPGDLEYKPLRGKRVRITLEIEDA